MSRKDSLGIEVEVGDIVFSAPRHKWSSNPEVGQVVGVFDSGRVTIKVPVKVPVYAYQEGAPDIDQKTYRHVVDPDMPRDHYGRRPYKREEYTYKAKDYTVLRHEWKWVRKQAADITLIVLKKNGSDLKSLAEVAGIDVLTKGLTMNYDAVTPELD